MKRITKTQLNVLDAINTFIRKRKYSPSLQNICDALGLKSRSTAYGHLINLKKAGYIDWVEGQPRTLKVIKEVTEEDRTRLKPKFEYAY
jgi:SOS-response transcriptional repressor LexA